MVYSVSGSLIFLFALFLISLCIIMFIRPALGKSFLESFASSAKAHYIEQGIRLVIGVALILHQSNNHFGYYLHLVGWLIVITTIGLLLIPWKWHHTFASWVIPPVIRFMKLYALLLLASGVFLLWAV